MSEHIPAEVRLLLAAIRDALDVPMAAGDEDQPGVWALRERIAYVRGVLQTATDGQVSSINALVGALRKAEGSAR